MVGLGIGYHFLVRKDGSIYEGRPIEYVGAHAYGSNYNSIGICCEGNFETEQMTDAQVQSVRWLINYLKEKYGNLRVRKHSEVCKTSCPGKNYRFTEVTNVEIKLVVDEKKERIKELQRLLNKIYGTKLVIDGVIGKQTNEALRRVALKNYTANELVTFVQRRLIMNGRSVGAYGADGKYRKRYSQCSKEIPKRKRINSRWYSRNKHNKSIIIGG